MKTFLIDEDTFTLEALIDACTICARMGWALRKHETDSALELSFPKVDENLVDFIFGEFI